MFFKISYVFFACVCISCSGKTDFLLKIPSQEENFPLKTSHAKNLTFFRFSDESCLAIKDFVESNGNSALCVTLSVPKLPKKEFSPSQLGFLYKNDFSASSSERLDAIKKRASVSFLLSDFATQKLSILISFLKDEPLPCGFYISSQKRCHILSAKIDIATVGVDFSLDSPLYAFSGNGGIVQKDKFRIDFSGVPLSFTSQNSENALLPELKIQFKKTLTPNSTEDVQIEQNSSLQKKSSNVKITFGSDLITVRDSGASYAKIPLASLKSPFSLLEVTENSELIESILLVQSSKTLLENSSIAKKSPIRPIKIDPGLIMQWPQTSWRGKDYELFEWDRFEGVLFFDTLDYKIQDEFFRRLAYFVEKQGYRGKLLSDSALQGKHAYNAHDYRAESLAQFFEKARCINFPLNQKERLLKEILVLNGVLKIDSNGQVLPGMGAVISISQESPLYLRTTFIAHEGWHGIFFIDEPFRDTVASVYYTLCATDFASVNFLVKYFQVTPSLNYDTNDDYLMKNEFMAYMLQRPVSQVEKYYIDMASREHSQFLIKNEADYIIKTKAAAFVGAAQMLEDYVAERWNLAAGRVWLLSR